MYTISLSVLTGLTGMGPLLGVETLVALWKGGGDTRLTSGEPCISAHYQKVFSWKIYSTLVLQTLLYKLV